MSEENLIIRDKLLDVDTIHDLDNLKLSLLSIKNNIRLSPFLIKYINSEVYVQLQELACKIYDTVDTNVYLLWDKNKKEAEELTYSKIFKGEEAIDNLTNFLLDDSSDWNEFKRIYTGKLFVDYLNKIMTEIPQGKKGDKIEFLIIMIQNLRDELNENPIISQSHIKINQYLTEYKTLTTKYIDELAEITNLIDEINHNQIIYVDCIEGILTKYIGFSTSI